MMRRYREMRAAEKEKKRQKRLAAIRAIIKKRQDQMLIDDVLNRSHQTKQEDDYDKGNHVKWDQNSEEHVQNTWD